jgi:hypothetical protein
MLHDIVGYWASTMVFLTFVTTDMRLLRILAIFSNVAFLSYGLLVWLPPVFCLHLILLPINIVRLHQILRVADSPVSGHWLQALASKIPSCPSDPPADNCLIVTLPPSVGLQMPRLPRLP